MHAAGFRLRRAVPEVAKAKRLLGPQVPEALGGSAHIISSLAQYEQVFDLAPSRSNAMTFCACASESPQAQPTQTCVLKERTAVQVRAA